MWRFREMKDKLTNVVMNYTEIEGKVREATNDEAWGTTGTLRQELAQATFSYDQFPEVMGMLWKRIAENKGSPRRIYKSLLLVHHLLLNGSDRVIRATTDRLYEIRQLQDYHVVYEPGFNIASIIPVDEYKDGEMNVRVKAKEIVDLIQDEDRLREDRKKSKKNRDKYVGIGSDRSMSKWNDFDEDLQFPRQSSSKYDDFDGEEDNTSIGVGGTKSSKSSNNKDSPTSLNTKLKSPTVVSDDDDFNPRADEEKSGISSFAKVTASTVPAGGVSTKSMDGDFADFQSAFGNSDNGATNSTNHSSTLTTSSTNSRAIHESNDLLALAPAVAHASSSSTSNSVDLLGLDISPSIFSPAQTQHVIGSNSSTLSSSFDAFQGFQAGGGVQNLSQGPGFFSLGGATTFGAQNIQSAPPPPVFQSFQFQQQPQPLQSQLHNQQQHNMLFASVVPNDGDPFGLGVLEPQQVNNINNNHVQAAAAGKGSGNIISLEGTTWSGMNISIDDLSHSAKPKAMAQPSMNQLLSSPTRSNSKPF